MPPIETSVLIVEDEPEIRKFLMAVLGGHGFAPYYAETGREGLKLTNSRPPDIVILDLGLPDMEGLSFIAQVRAWSRVPILVLSARGREQDKVAALEAGADDYITKPFGEAELLARLRVAQRRLLQAAAGPSGLFENGELRIDLERRLVFLRDKQIELTPTEYKMLGLLAQNVGKVVTHKQLLTEIWGRNAEENNHYLRIYAQHLRRKLGDDPMMPKFIVTEPGVGYRLKEC